MLRGSVSLRQLRENSLFPLQRSTVRFPATLLRFRVFLGNLPTGITLRLPANPPLVLRVLSCVLAIPLLVAMRLLSHLVLWCLKILLSLAIFLRSEAMRLMLMMVIWSRFASSSFLREILLLRAPLYVFLARNQTPILLST